MKRLAILLLGAVIGAVLGFVGIVAFGVIDTALHGPPLRDLDLSYAVGMTTFVGGMSAGVCAVIGLGLGFLYWAYYSIDR
jgi:hypothetical protein